MKINKNKYLNRIILLAAIFLFLLSKIIYSYNEEYLISNKVDEKYYNKCLDIKINSPKYIVYDRKSKRMLIGKNENLKCAMASTTKIMTAIIAIENSDLDEIITIEGKAAYIGGSRLGLKKGDKITRRDLLYGLLLRSGNDAAIALAESISDNVEEFVRLMNKKVKELELKNTHFMNPHGLDNDKHYTTALELAKITDYALNNKIFSKIVSTKNAVIKINEEQRELRNTNELLGRLDGIVGVKTGFTNKAGRCLVTNYKKEDIDIIIVVLGANSRKDRMEDSIKLINYIKENFKNINIYEIVENKFYQWKKMNKIKIIKGNSEYVEIELENNKISKMLLNNDERESLIIKISAIDKINAPIEKNTIVGKLEIIINGDKIIKYNMKNINKVNKKNWKNYFKQIIIETFY